MNRPRCTSCLEPAVQRVLKPRSTVSFRCKGHQLTKAAARKAGVVLTDLGIEERRGER